MVFGGVWLDNSVSIKLPELEIGSATVRWFGTKQVIVIQPHLSIELRIALWGNLRWCCTPLVQCICAFLGNGRRFSSGSCETQQRCLSQGYTGQVLHFSAALVFLVYIEGESGIAGILGCFILLVSRFKIMWLSLLPKRRTQVKLSWTKSFTCSESKMHRTSQACQQPTARQNTPGHRLGQEVAICGSWLWAAGCIGCVFSVVQGCSCCMERSAFHFK